MIAYCLEGLATVACTQGAVASMQRGCLAVAATLREAIGAPLPPANRTVYEHTTGDLRTMLGDEMFQAAWAAGRALLLDQAIAEALAMPGPA